MPPQASGNPKLTSGFSSEVRRALRALYRKLYHRDRLFSESLREALADRDACIPEVRAVLDFYEKSHHRVTFWSRTADESDGDRSPEGVRR